MAGPWLITGVDGQLGDALRKRCELEGLSCDGRDIDTLDICNAGAVRDWISEARPSVVVNCAADTAVDACEERPDRAMLVNGEAVGNLASACNRTGTLLVQISTDYVFSGDGDRPYREDDPVQPCSAYGRSKLRGEELAASAERHLIVRTAWLYGHGGRNFVEAIRRQIEDGVSSLRVVHDQRGSPTFAGDLAQALVGIVSAGTRGVVHAVNSGATTWHGFAEEIVRRLGANVDVIPVTTEAYPRRAPRPAYSVLDTSRLTRALGHAMPDWRDGLARYLRLP